MNEVNIDAVQASKANELCSFAFEPNKSYERSD